MDRRPDLGGAGAAEGAALDRRQLAVRVSALCAAFGGPLAPLLLARFDGVLDGETRAGWDRPTPMHDARSGELLRFDRRPNTSPRSC